MRKFVGVLSLGLFLAMPMSALAQEDAGTVEDGAVVVEDAGVVTDDAGTVAEDAGAVVEDAGAATEDAGAVTACGDITYQGTCDGDMMTYCDDGELKEVDCSGEAYWDADNNSGSHSQTTCGLVDCADDGCYGYGCVAKTGESCAMGEACDVEAPNGCIGGVCAASTACDPETDSTVSCAGDVGTFCNYSTTEYDCSAGGSEPYTCVVPSEANTSFCVGLEGGQCGTGSDGVTQFVCATGLNCIGGICSAGSAGTDAGTTTGTDAGTTTGTDAGTTTGTDAGTAGSGNDNASGSCAATSTGASAAMILLGLIGLAVIRRRR